MAYRRHLIWFLKTAPRRGLWKTAKGAISLTRTVAEKRARRHATRLVPAVEAYRELLEMQKKFLELQTKQLDAQIGLLRDTYFKLYFTKAKRTLPSRQRRRRNLIKKIKRIAETVRADRNQYDFIMPDGSRHIVYGRDVSEEWRRHMKKVRMAEKAAKKQWPLAPLNMPPT